MGGSLGDAPRARDWLPGTVPTVRPQRQPSDARRFSKEELQELRQCLEPAYRAGFRLHLRCGHCRNRRLLDEIVITHDLHHDSYSLVSNLPSSARPGQRSARR